MIGWPHRCDGHEFEQAPGVGDGQGGLACCSPWGHKESDTTEGLHLHIGSSKKQESSRKTSTYALLTMPKLLTVWITTSLENSERDGNTRPPDLAPEKSVCRSRYNSQNLTWNNGLVPNWERTMSKLFIVTLIVSLLCRVHDAKSRVDEAQTGIRITG